MNTAELLQKYHNIVEGTFNDLSDFDFCGVYILCDKNEDIVYIGSAYARTIKIRLQQYLRPKDTGNTLGKTIAKKIASTTKFDEEAKSMMQEAVRIIQNFKIYAIEHNDLEYQLINLAKPDYNNLGKDED